MKRYTHRAIVTVPPHAEFPLDMLRYDQCYPATENDSALILRTTDRSRDTNAITVERSSTSSQWSVAFTVARWQSFGVSIRQAS